MTETMTREVCRQNVCVLERGDRYTDRETEQQIERKRSRQSDKDTQSECIAL